MNIAEIFKKQTDKTLRQRSQGPNAGMTIIESGAGENEVSNPASDLTKHKSSGDHDGRYYTQAEVDALLVNAGGYWEPLTNGDITTPELIFYNGDIVMAEVI